MKQGRALWYIPCFRTGKHRYGKRTSEDIKGDDHPKTKFELNGETLELGALELRAASFHIPQETTADILRGRKVEVVLPSGVGARAIPAAADYPPTC